MKFIFTITLFIVTGGALFHLAMNGRKMNVLTTDERVNTKDTIKFMAGMLSGGIILAASLCKQWMK